MQNTDKKGHNPRGRPKAGRTRVPLTLTLDASAIAALKKMASRYQRSQSYVAERLIMHAQTYQDETDQIVTKIQPPTPQRPEGDPDDTATSE